MDHWVWRTCWWGFAVEYGEPAAEDLKGTKYMLIEADVGSKYGLASKYKWDGLAIAIFWKFIDVLDYFHVKLYWYSFEKTHIYFNTLHFI